jgi:hypothetical protein
MSSSLRLEMLGKDYPTQSGLGKLVEFSMAFEAEVVVLSL